MRFGAAGGRTIVDVTVGGLQPQPEKLAALAKAAGVFVVFGAGYYVDAYLPDDVAEMGTEWTALGMDIEPEDGLSFHLGPYELEPATYLLRARLLDTDPSRTRDGYGVLNGVPCFRGN